MATEKFSFRFNHR
ncbi:hypothetical protein LINPERHAP1_LOCUS34917 [Linum perenne]